MCCSGLDLDGGDVICEVRVISVNICNVLLLFILCFG